MLREREGGERSRAIEAGRESDRGGRVGAQTYEERERVREKRWRKRRNALSVGC